MCYILSASDFSAPALQRRNTTSPNPTCPETEAFLKIRPVTSFTTTGLVQRCMCECASLPCRFASRKTGCSSSMRGLKCDSYLRQLPNPDVLIGWRTCNDWCGSLTEYIAKHDKQPRSPEPSSLSELGAATGGNLTCAG